MGGRHLMEIKGIQGIQKTAKFSRQEHTDRGGFQQYLDQVAKNGQSDTSVKEAASLPEVHPITILTFESNDIKLVDETNRVINLLEQYSKELSDPAIPLKQLEPTLADFKNEAEKLYNDYAGIHDNNSNFEEIMNNLKLIANVEYFKFHRGDYI